MAVSTSVLMALVAALASCTEAATVVLKVSDNTLLKTKGSGDGTATTSVLKASSETFNFNAQNFSSVANITDVEVDDGTSGGTTAIDEDALSAVWYLAAFGGLVLFFFVVTCSEMFFGNPIYMRHNSNLPDGYLRRQLYGIRNQQRHGGHYGPETPPPAYHLFAPPSYDDTVKSAGVFTANVQQHYHLQQQHGDKKLTDVFVVPVHGGGAAVTAVSAMMTTTAMMDAKLLAAVMPAETKSK